jgi:hypothetical protein
MDDTAWMDGNPWIPQETMEHRNSWVPWMDGTPWIDGAGGYYQDPDVSAPSVGSQSLAGANAYRSHKACNKIPKSNRSNKIPSRSLGGLSKSQETAQRRVGPHHPFINDVPDLGWPSQHEIERQKQRSQSHVRLPAHRALREPSGRDSSAGHVRAQNAAQGQPDMTPSEIMFSPKQGARLQTVAPTSLPPPGVHGSEKVEKNLVAAGMEPHRKQREEDVMTLGLLSYCISSPRSSTCKKVTSHCDSVDDSTTNQQGSLSRSRSGPSKVWEEIVAHDSSNCRPCHFLFSKSNGCRQGSSCLFCHLCPRGAMKEKRKRITKRVRALEAALERAIAGDEGSP